MTLTHIFFYLAQQPEEMQKLRAVLDPILSSGDSIEDAMLKNVDHLNGIINEALRLHPPVPSGLLRMTPPQGLQLGDVFIPGNTTVSTPFHPLGRCKSTPHAARHQSRKQKKKNRNKNKRNASRKDLLTSCLNRS